MASSSSSAAGGTPDSRARTARARSSQASIQRDYGDVTGVLLVGGASARFGTPKALAELDGETLAERAWRVVGDAFPHRLAVGKAGDGLELPFPIVDDESDLRAPIVGVVAALRAVETDVCVCLPVDVPLVTAAALRRLADACLDAAVPLPGPLPGAFRRTALPALSWALEERRLALHRALAELEVAVVELDPATLVNVNEPADLERVRAAS